MTEDSVLVLSHDNNIDRTTNGRGRISVEKVAADMAPDLNISATKSPLYVAMCRKTKTPWSTFIRKVTKVFFFYACFARISGELGRFYNYF